MVRYLSGLSMPITTEEETLLITLTRQSVINGSFDDSFIKWLNLLFHIPSKYNNNYYNYISQLFWYRDPASYAVCSITAFFAFSHIILICLLLYCLLCLVYGHMGILPYVCVALSASYETYCDCHFVYTKRICLGVRNF